MMIEEKDGKLYHHKRVGMTFTYKELKCFLFKKKRCLNCGAKMKRNKAWEWKPWKEVDRHKTDEILIKVYHYYYTCTMCSGKFTLSELANAKNSD